MGAGACGKNHALYFFGVGMVGLLALRACLKDCTIIGSFAHRPGLSPLQQFTDTKPVTTTTTTIISAQDCHSLFA